jgi:hypothetical protein
MLSPLMTLPILAVFIAVTLVAPSWRYCAGFIACSSGALIYVWFRHWHATTMPGYDEGPGGTLGIAMIATLTLAFAISVVVYFIGLAWISSKE